MPRPSKPRVCGDDPYEPDVVSVAIGVNPACAGMIPAAVTMGYHVACKPRVCGDDPDKRDDTDHAAGVNPACAGMILYGD